MRALVLSGGGARGAYEAGVIQGLHEAGMTYDLVCGTSIGALNGSFVASNKFDDLAATWADIAAQRVITLLPIVESIRTLATDLMKLSHDRWLAWAKDAFGAFNDYRKLGPMDDLFGLMGAIAPEPIEAVLRRI